MKLNKYIDSTKLGANVSKVDIDLLLDEAIEHDFKSVCVNPIWVKYVKDRLKGSDVLTCTVIGFPHGTHLSSVKAYETKEALKDGADEFDMVINVDALISRDYDLVYKDIKQVVDSAKGKTVKVIIETCYLTDEEIVEACKLAKKAKAQFVKTSTGFGKGGATQEHVRLMKQTVGDELEVKASGGVRTKEDAISMIEAGATRIGTSNGVKIIKGENNNEDTNSTY